MKSTSGRPFDEEASNERKYVSLHTNPPASSFHLIAETPIRYFSMKFVGSFVSSFDVPGDIVPEVSFLPELSGILI